MKDRVSQPEWPVPIYATRDEAIAGALASLDEPGDAEITIHQDGCAMGRDLDCDCQPDVRVISEGRA